MSNTSVKIDYSDTVDSWAYIAIREAGFGAGATASYQVHGEKAITLVVDEEDVDVARFIDVVSEALTLWLEGRFLTPQQARGWAANVVAVWED